MTTHSTTAFISPPTRIPFPLRLGLWAVRRLAGKDLLPAQLLTWYPRAAVSSGILEALIAPPEGHLTERLLKLIRLQVSLIIACPFCIDLNSLEADRFKITEDELAALRGYRPADSVSSFTAPERFAIAYAQAASQTPPDFAPDLIAKLKTHFTEREFVILATTIAQVNYWARLAQGLGVPLGGFSDQCELPGSGMSPMTDQRI
jgi:alkylhydroperoxidase family enzyme